MDDGLKILRNPFSRHKINLLFEKSLQIKLHLDEFQSNLASVIQFNKNVQVAVNGSGTIGIRTKYICPQDRFIPEVFDDKLLLSFSEFHRYSKVRILLPTGHRLPLTKKGAILPDKHLYFHTNTCLKYS